LSYIGYDDKKIQMGLLEKKNCSTLELSPKENMLDIGLVVKDYILPSVEEGKAYSSVGLNYKRMVEEENFLDSDVLQNIQMLPGLISFDESATNISIRGNDPGHSITRWENVQLYNAGHFFGMLSAINPYLVNDVQVYKSSFHPNLGNSIGGVIDISLSDKITKKFNGGAGIDLTKAFSYFNIPVLKNKLSISVAAQISIYNEWLNSPTLSSYANAIFQHEIPDEDTKMKDKFEERSATEIQFYDVTAKLNYKPNKKWAVHTSFFKAVDIFEYESMIDRREFELDEYITTNSTVAQIEATFKPRQNHQLKGFISYSDYTNTNGSVFKQKDDDDSFDENAILNSIGSIEVGLSYQLKHHKQWLSDFSINLENNNLLYNIDERSLFEEEDIDDDAIEDAIFVHQDINTNFTNKKWAVDIGLRSTLHTHHLDFYFSPRANVQYKISDVLTINLLAS